MFDFVFMISYREYCTIPYHFGPIIIICVNNDIIDIILWYGTTDNDVPLCGHG